MEARSPTTVVRFYGSAVEELDTVAVLVTAPPFSNHTHLACCCLIWNVIMAFTIRQSFSFLPFRRGSASMTSEEDL